MKRTLLKDREINLIIKARNSYKYSNLFEELESVSDDLNDTLPSLQEDSNYYEEEQETLIKGLEQKMNSRRMMPIHYFSRRKSGFYLECASYQFII